MQKLIESFQIQVTCIQHGFVLLEGREARIKEHD